MKLFVASVMLVAGLTCGSLLPAETPSNQLPEYIPANLYPPPAKRAPSPGHTIYYVQPGKGDDANSGIKPEQAWRSFVPVNAKILAPGDRVEILAPGTFNETLMPMGAGTADEPITIHFAPGEYDFFPANALKLKLHITNTNDDPNTPKAIALAFQGVRNLRIVGGDGGTAAIKTNLFIHGKMIETFFDHAQNVTLQGLAFDYRRPSVSEYTVAEVTADHADLNIHPDSTYAIEKDRLVWIGEGWRYAAPGFSQQGNPVEGTLWRSGNPLGGCTKVEEIAHNSVRAWFKSNPGFTKGQVFQDRNTFRDCAGSFARNSKDIVWKDCAYYCIHGMGLVNQYCENLTVDHVRLAPREGSGRTNACWADAIQVSGCKGSFIADGCVFSGLQDDPINVHGTHLRIVGRPAPDQVLVRFMHPQTYGFEAFFAGDEIAFIHHDSLVECGRGKVKTAEMRGEKEMLLTLQGPIPDHVEADDVVDNVTWYPDVTIRNCTVAMDSCRGFLLSSRGKTLVENNTFTKTTMSAILIADDANSWFESGPVRDVVIRNNRFIRCAEPVINISPENRTTKDPVHENIRIEGNFFDLTGGSGVSAKSVNGLTVTGNRFSAANFEVQTNACTNVNIRDNRPGVKHTFSLDTNDFLLDGKPFQVIGGEMHPARIPHEYWRHRIRMAKAMGLNTIPIYIFWNAHEPEEGKFDFTTGENNIGEFLKIAKEEGMWVVLRPGPYCCAEWDLGGLPWWLMKTPDIKLRCSDPRFTGPVEKYFHELAKIVRPNLVENGGSILMVQIENEYGSYPRRDHDYMVWLRDLWVKEGVNGPFITADGAGENYLKGIVIPGVAVGLDTGTNEAEFALARKLNPGVPIMSSEVYPGWLRHWGEGDWGPTNVTGLVKFYMDTHKSFSLYVFHGGTNFGFTAGANGNSPSITSYDYGAPLNEQGCPTPAYNAYRKQLASYLPAGQTLPDVPETIPTMTIPEIKLERWSGLWEQLPAPVTSEQPKYFEELGQNQGFVVYRTRIAAGDKGKLSIHVNGYPQVYLDGALVKGFDLPARSKEATLEILVEAMGHINFQGEMEGDRKGIRGEVKLNGAVLKNWEMLLLPLKNDWAMNLSKTTPAEGRIGGIFKGEFTLDAVADTYLDMSKYKKGVLWVNGHNLGRHWSAKGPQKRLYCPAPWLNKGSNTIVVLDVEEVQPQSVTGFATAR